MLIYNFIFLFYFKSFSFIDSLSTHYREFLWAKIDSLAQTKTLENGMLSVSIIKCKTGEKVIQYNDNKLLRPASTLKLITTATALGVLGENFRYKTDLEYNGIIRNDTLIGNLIIKGSGDPTLGSWRFDETLDYSRQILHWAEDIQKLKIKVIVGEILVNSSIFSENIVPETWQWGDLGNYYGAAAFGLNLNENQVKFHFKTNRKSGENTEIFKTEPFLPDMEIRNKVLSDKNTFGDNVFLFSAPYTHIISAEGKLPIGRENFVVKGSMPDPAKLTVSLLKSTISKLGLQIIAAKNTNFKPTNFLINRVNSPSLLEICTLTNYESINLNAESLLKTIVKSKSNQITTADGVIQVNDFWKGKGLNMRELYMKDGSGLSTANAVSANFMADLLAKTSKEPFFTGFLQTIPIVGQDGTMKNIAKNKNWAKNFSVKSGTVEKVKAFAGYFTNENNELFSFSIMANQFEGSVSAMSRELTKLFEPMWYLK
jgi:serine-type D-Ala-D-Ala carboxypeptidase/endopeptidase (penicillin-binding protein 4)